MSVVNSSLLRFSKDVFSHSKTSKHAPLALPLFKNQSFLNSANIYNGETIDINLDIFRDVPFNVRFHSIRWYAHITGINLNMEDSFLSVEPHQAIKNKIVIVRSPRYRNEYINYKFPNLKQVETQDYTQIWFEDSDKNKYSYSQELNK